MINEVFMNIDTYKGGVISKYCNCSTIIVQLSLV